MSCFKVLNFCEYVIFFGTLVSPHSKTSMAALRILCVFLDLDKISNHELTRDVNFD
jgi:hypothetical protein